MTLCPKCGEPPRARIGIYRVKEMLIRNGDVMIPTGEFRLNKLISPTCTYRCGGNHEWEDGTEGNEEYEYEGE